MKVILKYISIMFAVCCQQVAALDLIDVIVGRWNIQNSGYLADIHTGSGMVEIYTNRTFDLISGTFSAIGMGSEGFCSHVKESQKYTVLTSNLIEFVHINKTTENKVIPEVLEINKDKIILRNHSGGGCGALGYVPLSILTRIDTVAETEPEIVETPPANIPPTAAFSISTTHGEAPLTVTLDASASFDPDSSIVSYVWTANGQHFASSNSIVSNTFTPGEYTITLTVTDNQGLTATAQRHVSVAAPNKAPMAQLAASPIQGQAPLTVTLNGNASYDPDGAIAYYSWWASDGQTFVSETSSQATMTFSTPGIYTINMGVGDNEGVASTNTALQTVTVTEAPKPPVAIFTASSNEGAAPLTVTLDASGSHDPDGSIVTYEWRINDALFSLVDNSDPLSFTFEHEGEYNVVLIVTDNQGLTATTQQNISVTVPSPSVVIPESIGKAIIIAGGGAHRQNTLFDYSNDLSRRMYFMLTRRGFTNADIIYLNPIDWQDIDGDGVNDDVVDFQLVEPVDELATAFQSVATDLVAGQQFVFYVHTHARPDYLKINREYELSAQELQDLLAQIPVGVEQIIILDTCHSGSFIDNLSGVPQRTVLTSADPDSTAWNVEYNNFSEILIPELWAGYSLNDAFLTTRDKMSNEPSFREQRPQLDDNSDGSPNTSNDGTRAAGIYIGGEGIIAAALPEILEIHEPLIVPEGEASAVLWIKTSPSGNTGGLQKVLAILIQPNLQITDYQGEETQFSRLEVEMLYNPAQDRYERVYDNFRESGTWKVLYQAQSTTGEWSANAFGEVQAGGVVNLVTIDAVLNQSAYQIGEQLKFTLKTNGDPNRTDLYDLYAVILFPQGDFITIAYPQDNSMPNTIESYQSGINLAGSKTFSILDEPLLKGMVSGTYHYCGIVAPANADPWKLENWVHWDCQGFELR